MMVLVTLTVGLVFWIVAWATLGVRAFDAFLLTTFITFVAAAVRITMPFVEKLMKRRPSTPGER